MTETLGILISFFQEWHQGVLCSLAVYNTIEGRHFSDELTYCARYSTVQLIPARVIAFLCTFQSDM